MKKIQIILSFGLFILLVLTGFLPKAEPSESAVLSINAGQSVENTKEKIEVALPSPTPAPVAKPVVQKKALVAVQPKISAPRPAPAPSPVPQPVVCDVGSFNTQFLCLINEYRKSKNLNALIYDAGLNATAVDHSTWMNANKIMSHIGENGSIFTERCAAHNVKCDAENVAMGYTTPEKLFNAWKASPGHNANMLGSHTKMGLSLVGIYATQLFR